MGANIETGVHMTLKVINAGLSRTGTLTLKVALERLGFGPCYHSFEFYGRPDHTPLWREALDAGVGYDWDRIFDTYQSTVDVPSVYFWRALADAYPDSRLILTERDPERWCDSFLRVLEGTKAGVADGVAPMPADSLDVVFRILAAQFPVDDSVPPDRGRLIEAYLRHNDAVRQAIPADRLLNYRVSEGWAPLSKFLGVDLPDEPFPHVNAGLTVFDNGTLAAERTSRTSEHLAWR
jgi:hypothetical protein